MKHSLAFVTWFFRKIAWDSYGQSDTWCGPEAKTLY